MMNEKTHTSGFLVLEVPAPYKDHRRVFGGGDPHALAAGHRHKTVPPHPRNSPGRWMARATTTVLYKIWLRQLCVALWWRSSGDYAPSHNFATYTRLFHPEKLSQDKRPVVPPGPIRFCGAGWWIGRRQYQVLLHFPWRGERKPLK